jgi:hypothetical protein
MRKGEGENKCPKFFCEKDRGLPLTLTLSSPESEKEIGVVLQYINLVITSFSTASVGMWEFTCHQA